jgi:hypothetical protein
LSFVVICVSSFLSLFALDRFPRPDPRKRPALVLVLCLAGCGGGGSDRPAQQEVRGAGYAFNAPQGWEVTRSGRTVTASAPDEVVSVTRFQLNRPFGPKLATQVKRELDRVTRGLATKLEGRVDSSRKTSIGSRPAWVYRFSGMRDDTREIAFVFAGRREYQLLCRGRGEDSGCRLLFRTFALA